MRWKARSERSYGMKARDIMTDGVVHYWGMLESEDERRAARVAAENVPGVRKVEDHRLRLADLPSMW